MATDRYIDLLKQGLMKPAKQRINTHMPNRFECFTDANGSFSYAQTLSEAKKTVKAMLPLLLERAECVYVRDRAKDCQTVAKWLKVPAAKPGVFKWTKA